MAIAKEFRVFHLRVVAGDRLVGCLSVGDLFSSHVARAEQDAVFAAEKNCLERTRVIRLPGGVASRDVGQKGSPKVRETSAKAANAVVDRNSPI